ncbi:MAG TPA: hypothetical protein VGS21_07505, partial [Acidimicrobiales bacterium]|nr:hypothetical protein [Acidimicrobiales bacterium]
TRCWATNMNVGATTEWSLAATTNGGGLWFLQGPPGQNSGGYSVSCENWSTCQAITAGSLWSTTDGGGSSEYPISAESSFTPTEPMVGQVFYVEALFRDLGNLAVAKPTTAAFYFDGQLMSFCAQQALTFVTGNEWLAYCALYITTPSTFRTGSFTISATVAQTVFTQQATTSVVVPVHSPGYRFVAADGGIFTFGGLHYLGSVPGLGVKTESVVGMASDYETGGYFVPLANRITYGFGTAFTGHPGGPLTAPISGIASTLDGKGYWLVQKDGAVENYGDAYYYGRVIGVPAAYPIVGIAATPNDGGYWLVESDGEVFPFGDASGPQEPPIRGVNDIVGIAPTTQGDGYWLVGRDGGIFTFGYAKYYGSEGGVHLTKPIVGIAADTATGGYWMVGGDGGIFSFHAPYLGGTGGIHLNQPILGMAAG